MRTAPVQEWPLPPARTLAAGARVSILIPSNGRPLRMKIETLAVHAGYSPDPTTKAVAVPIYQTVAYAFDSAQPVANIHPVANDRIQQ